MSEEKRFDCLAYKRAIQEKHYRDTLGLSLAEKARLRKRWLESSENPAAQLGRAMMAEAATAKRRLLEI